MMTPHGIGGRVCLYDLSIHVPSHARPRQLRRTFMDFAEIIVRKHAPSRTFVNHRHDMLLAVGLRVWVRRR